MRSIVVISLLVVATGMLSSCVGFIANTPEECKYETPYTGAHDYFWKPQKTNVVRPSGDGLPEAAGSSNLPGLYPAISTKDDFLREWGEPDKINISEDEEVWVYSRILWCGYIPVFLLPLPLVLPVCEGFDQVHFKGAEAKRLHTRKNVFAGFVAVGLGGGGGLFGGHDPVCRFPLPVGPAYTNVDMIPDDAGLVFMYWPGSGSDTTMAQYAISTRDNYIATLFPGSYYSFLVPVGTKEFIFKSLGHSTKKVTIEINKKQTYYFKISSHVFKSDEVSLTDPEIAKSEINKCILLTNR